MGRWPPPSAHPLAVESPPSSSSSACPRLDSAGGDEEDRREPGIGPSCGSSTSSRATCRLCAMEDQSLRFTRSARRWRQEVMKSKSLPRTLTGRGTVPYQSDFPLIWMALRSNIFFVLRSEDFIGRQRVRRAKLAFLTYSRPEACWSGI